MLLYHLARVVQDIVEELVGHPDDLAFLQEWIPDEAALAELGFGDLDFRPVLGVNEGGHHALVPAVLLEDVHAVETQRSIVWQRSQRGKPGKRRDTEQRAVGESDAILEPLHRRQLEYVLYAVAVRDGREDALQGRRIDEIGALGIRELESDAEIVSALLDLRKKSVLGLHRREETCLFDERDLYHRFPVHLLPVHVQLEIARIEIDDGRFFLRHQWPVDLGDDLLAAVGQDTHELLVWSERLAEFEV